LVFLSSYFSNDFLKLGKKAQLFAVLPDRLGGGGGAVFPCVASLVAKPKNDLVHGMYEL
jgi:hypothetical protein